MRGMTRASGYLVLVTIGLGLGGCDSESSEMELASPATEAATEVPPAAPEATQPPADLTDPQIAHVAVTANTIDVDMARLAETRTSTESVLAFAETMITDHTAVNEQAAALAQRLGVTPEMNEVSRSLQADAADSQAQLQNLRNAEFDRAYIAREVEYHQAVLDALDNTLIPSTENAELKALLEQVRPAIVAHLERARSIQASLS